MGKNKFSWKEFGFLLGVVIILVGLAAPHYVWVLERGNAANAQAALVNWVIAENSYFIQYKEYTNDWKALAVFEPFMDKSKGVFSPAGEAGEERFFAFSRAELYSAEKGFSFGIEIDEGSSSGKIYAVRAGSFFTYTLVAAFPEPVFICEAESTVGKWFCGRFSAYIDPFLLQKKETNPPVENSTQS